jgi:hypothetical protein
MSGFWVMHCRHAGEDEAEAATLAAMIAAPFGILG